MHCRCSFKNKCLYTDCVLHSLVLGEFMRSVKKGDPCLILRYDVFPFFDMSSERVWNVAGEPCNPAKTNILVVRFGLTQLMYHFHCR
jgi:hypothetical protein